MFNYALSCIFASVQLKVLCDLPFLCQDIAKIYHILDINGI